MLTLTWKRSVTVEMSVLRVASPPSSIETELYVHFVQFALRPLTRFNAVFQTTSSKISTMQSDSYIGSASLLPQTLFKPVCYAQLMR